MEVKSKEIKLVDIDLLAENPKNNNKHPKDQIDRLAKIINFSGFRNPLIVSKRSGFVLAGHGRIQAARKLGMKELPVIYQDFKDEAEEYAYLTADNAIARWADLDLSMVNQEMLDLGPDFDVDMLGVKDFVIEPIEKYLDGDVSWDGMPDIGDNTGRTEKAFGKVIVWFESEMFYEKFKRLIDQEFIISNKSMTNSIWFPKR